MENFLTKNCPLFYGITADNFSELLNCLSAKPKKYSKGELIFTEGENIKNIGVIVSGDIDIIKQDYWGNTAIISKISAGDLFGESFAAGGNKINVSVQAVSDCTVLMLEFEKIITACSPSCKFHFLLIKNMLKILAEKNILLTEKIQHISKRNIREKLLSYFLSLAAKQDSDTFKIPFDRQGLADFLFVDRSALSRELSNMQSDGLISYSKNSFTLKTKKR